MAIRKRVPVFLFRFSLPFLEVNVKLIEFFLLLFDDVVVAAGREKNICQLATLFD